MNNEDRSNNSLYDCVVIGGGPAGTTAAALVADAGFSTLLVERERMPRFCVGESLMPETYWTLERLGVLEKMKASSFVRKVGVQFVSPSGRESQPFFFDRHDPRDCSQTWHVERADFDMLLFENARDKGAECRDQTRVLDITIQDAPPHSIQIQDAAGASRSLFAKVVVDATGQHAFLANRLGLRVTDPQLRKAAIWGYYRGAKRNGKRSPELTTILHTEEKRNWFWYIPMSNDMVSVGLVGDRDDLLRSTDSPDVVYRAEQLRCPGLQERVIGAELVGRLRVAKEFSYTTSDHVGNGWVLVGDAYGFIDPIYSTGVFLALKSGEMAADCIVEGLRVGDISAEQWGKWTAEYDAGVLLFRKLVQAFYTREFSIASFVKAHPEHQDNLTDLLIGRAFASGAGRIFEDLDPAILACRLKDSDG